MYPTGTRVTVQRVDDLAEPDQGLIGRTGIVIDHEGDHNLVAGLTRGDRITGVRAFSDDDLTPGPAGAPPIMPPFYRVRGYYLPAQP
jgi:hypothetical protein